MRLPVIQPTTTAKGTANSAIWICGRREHGHRFSHCPGACYRVSFIAHVRKHFTQRYLQGSPANWACVLTEEPTATPIDLKCRK